MTELINVNVTPHELNLLKALRAEPNRVAMWTARGDPQATHKDLLGLYTRLFDICNRHQIEYWLEYGSLLGYVRHRGIIPWEWDMDIGCTSENYKKLLEVGAEIERTDPKWGFKFYHDPDYSVPAYCMYLKSNPDVLCDIAEYIEDGDLLRCAVSEWNYPPYLKSDILPVRRVQMLGQAAFIPCKGEKLLGKVETILGQCTGSADGKVILNKVPYQEYDPIPFLLTHLFNPHRSELLCSYPVLDVPEANSIAEGFALYAPKNLPFVVRKVKNVFKFDYESFKALAISTNATTNAYSKEMVEQYDVSMAQSLADWEAGVLNMNFIDSKITSLTTSENVDASLSEFTILPQLLQLILSNTNTSTKFHHDPFDLAFGGGGGWMWLAKGKKLWNFIDCLDSDPIYDRNNFEFISPTMDELLYLNNHALWGKIYQVFCEAEDFVWFPPAMTHRVTTYEKSIGFGGYTQLKCSEGRYPALNAWYADKKLDPKIGIWISSDYLGEHGSK